MARTLYRLYLYVVCVVMLGFAAFSLGSLLSTLLLETPLRAPQESVPNSQALVQTTVLAVVALVITLALGGLHYWLIRRDIAQDAGAATGAVRTLFLNLVQAAAAVVALEEGGSALTQVGQPQYGGLASMLAAALVALAVFAFMAYERQRALPAPGAAMVLQRLHLYGVQLGILLASIAVSMSAIGNTVRVILAAAGAIPNACMQLSPPPGMPYPLPYVQCPFPAALAGEWLALAWYLAGWLVYAAMARGDTRSILRLVAHFAGYVTGLVALLIGVYQAAELILRVLLGVPINITRALAWDYNFFPALLFGLVVLFGYGLWLAMEGHATRPGHLGTSLSVLAISAIVLGFPFYIGIAQLLDGALEAIAPNGQIYDAAAWATAGAILIAGLPHPVLALRLYQRWSEDAPIGPRRAYVLAGLATGSLATAISVAVALYLVITASLGSPVGPNWAVQARVAGVVVMVGGFVVGIHLWWLLSERKLMARRPAAAPAAATAPLVTPGGAALAEAERTSIEAVLDALQAGRITREQAVTQLRGMMHTDH